MSETIDIDYSEFPAPVLRGLRARQPRDLILRCRKPRSSAEENYLLLFEEFTPKIQVIEGSEPRGSYSPEGLGTPSGPFLPMTGEFLQSLCDYTVLNRDKLAEKCAWVGTACPPERQLLIEEEWPSKVYDAQSLFIYPMADSCTSNHVFSRTWPKLRLIVFHNSDYSLDYKIILTFLESHPKVYVWAENAIRWHPRIRCVPLGHANRNWYRPSIGDELPVEISRNEDRPIGVCVPHWGMTHPIRAQWRAEVDALSTPRIFRAAEMPRERYINFLTECQAMLCPPGNGYDTHRVWECLTMGVWPIVQDNAHTQLLLRQYPSLGLLTIDSPENLDMSGLDPPPGLPPFHPLLGREYWRILLESHMD